MNFVISVGYSSFPRKRESRSASRGDCPWTPSSAGLTANRTARGAQAVWYMHSGAPNPERNQSVCQGNQSTNHATAADVGRRQPLNGLGQ
jgi:hypothetical protein